ncbi:hypothetical protein I79_023725 [Cricetulus griseus]|uniref:Uncharacterized protein n=1 Tax=Cricetulus griseus TaxID=10029 RepID=G3IIQ2_CRIGR|nr:hypothetical protein I79_023725 [Cricetulus griseus]
MGTSSAYGVQGDSPEILQVRDPVSGYRAFEELQLLHPHTCLRCGSVSCWSVTASCNSTTFIISAITTTIFITTTTVITAFDTTVTLSTTSTITDDTIATITDITITSTITDATIATITVSTTSTVTMSTTIATITDTIIASTSVITATVIITATTSSSTNHYRCFVVTDLNQTEKKIKEENGKRMRKRSKMEKGKK